MKSRHAMILPLVVSGLAWTLPYLEARAQEDAAVRPASEQAAIRPRKPTRFLRVRSDEYQQPVALQTATAKYVLPGEGGRPRVEVFLESVVHVGDRSYFRGFNHRFRHYDAVLYELVAPPDRKIPDVSKNEPPHPLRLVQQLAAQGLGFSHQIDEIDYRAANLVHSDLTPQQLQAAVRERGDDEFTVLMESMIDVLRKMNREVGKRSEDAADDAPIGAAPANGTGDVNDTNDTGDALPTLDLSVFTDPEGAVRIRRLLAGALGENASLEAMLQPSQRATLIRARNDRAMEVFQEQLDAGHDRIALFWGAGHMEDFERRLILQYGFQPAGLVWRDAWDLREGAVDRAPLESILENSLRGSLKEAIEGLFPPAPR